MLHEIFCIVSRFHCMLYVSWKIDYLWHSASYYWVGVSWVGIYFTEGDSPTGGLATSVADPDDF